MRKITLRKNSETGRTTPDYINSYRVEMLKRKLQDRENLKYKILVLADDCGFSSKATLSRIFKQHTGQTPTEYRKSVLGQ